MMFENAVNEFDKLNVSDKKKRIIDEIKLMIVVMEKICIERKIDYRQVISQVILALKQENISEDDYLTALYVYIEYLKEVMGAYLSSEI